MPDPVETAATALWARYGTGRAPTPDSVDRTYAGVVVDALRDAGWVLLPIGHAPHARPTRFTLSLLPEGDINAIPYAVTVEYRGRDRWAVKQLVSCLGTDGRWSYESDHALLDKEWRASHQFDLATALRLAEEALPNINCNGTTAAEYMARKAAEEATPDA